MAHFLCRVSIVRVPTAYSFPSYIPAALRTRHSGADLPDDRLPGQRGLVFGRLRLVERPVIASYDYRSDQLRVVSLLRNFLSGIRFTRRHVYTPTVFEYPRVWESSYRTCQCVGLRSGSVRHAGDGLGLLGATPASLRVTRPRQTYQFPLERRVQVGPERAGGRPDDSVQRRSAAAEEPALSSSRAGRRQDRDAGDGGGQSADASCCPARKESPPRRLQPAQRHRNGAPKAGATPAAAAKPAAPTAPAVIRPNPSCNPRP